ncbi:hypothetical protein WICPIJ_007517 [Wickerhamomyces pijperi]|uniref:Uncharacterized protein n=1 Tax=Wickerhamomyces pijperi TaxID=599730 RepID=A0A9P8Q016_WICPI|nr:hypothetical protein WICPIJ_007517 [Wickerhamomyces pijperi]
MNTVSLFEYPTDFGGNSGINLNGYFLSKVSNNQKKSEYLLITFPGLAPPLPSPKLASGSSSLSVSEEPKFSTR